MCAIERKHSDVIHGDCTAPDIWDCKFKVEDLGQSMLALGGGGWVRMLPTK